MKNKLFILTAILSFFTGFQQAVAQCNPVHPHVDGGWIFTIDRYLARSISMQDLAVLRHTNPAAFTTEVNQLLPLRPTFLRRVSGVFGGENTFVPGMPEHTAAQQAVADINAAFDNACIPRPIIQAGFYEYISSSVNQVPIPQYVLQDFAANDPDFWTFNGGPNFNINDIQGAANTPDISKIEARMWFYYVATQYIDMGYMGLHAGWIAPYTVNDRPPVVSAALAYEKTARVFQMIRNYATMHNTWVVIDAHTDPDLYIGTSNHLLLDFKSAPFRIRELPQGTFMDEPCANEQYYGDLDPFTFHYEVLKSTGGAPPMAVSQGTGYEYDKTPIMFEWDWLFNVPKNLTANGNGFPWGYDETSWYEQVLTTDACKAYWIMNNACATKNDLYYRGYFQMPGRVWVFHDFPPSAPYNAQIRNLVNNNPTLRTGLLNDTWNPNDDLHFTIMPHCEETCIAGGTKTEKNYICRVTNPDCSSVYQWHVQKPDGSWLPVTYGTRRKLTNLGQGTYRITVVQNNLGMQNQSADPVIQAMRDLQVAHNGELGCEVFEYPAGMAKTSNGDYAALSPSAYAHAGAGTTQMLQTAKRTIADILTENLDLAVYPNPVKDKVTLEITAGKPEVISVYLTNSLGISQGVLLDNATMTTGTQSVTADVSHLPAGIYYITLKTVGETKTEKLTVIK